MNLKTYRARSMADALAEVKKDLGRDAVILHTRTLRVGGVLGVGGKDLVEVTASDSPPAVPRAGARTPTAPPARPPGRLDRFVPSSPAALARTLAAAAAAHAAPQAAAVAAAPPGPAPALVTEPQVERLPVRATCRGRELSPARDDELASIRRLIGQVLRRTAAPAGTTVGAPPGPLADCYLRLLEAEVAAEIAEDVIGRVRGELAPSEQSDPARVRECVLRALAALVPAPGDIPPPARAPDGRPLTVALIGPTGVGKTTTIAKLAAAYKLRHARRVGLVTTDTYRIAAVDQLRVYADIIGLPLKVATTPDDAGAACHALQDCDAILIDTAGRSQRDAARLEELRRFLDAAAPHHVHLCLAGTAGERLMMEAAANFAPLKPDRVIFTKLDEAVNFGVLISVAHRIAPRLSYLTTGQEVPDHIEPGRPERLARLVLDGVS